jgi:hypothetical protein
MNIFEVEIAKYEKRLNTIKNKPSATMLASNELLYKAHLEHNKEQLRWWQRGKPFISVSSSGGEIIMWAFGDYQPLNLVGIADRLGTGRAEETVDDVMAMGLPDYACDRTILFLPLAMEGQEMPKPRIIITRTGACNVINNTHVTMAELMKVPVYTIDIPFSDPHQEHLDYVTRQLKDCVKYIEENLPGAKYDEDRLVEWLGMMRRWYASLHDIYELRRKVPCPDHPRDVFREPLAPPNYAQPMPIVEYYESYRDELRARAAAHWSAVGEEKLRIIWAITGPYGSSVWDSLVKQGVSVPFWHYGAAKRIFQMPIIGEESEFGKKLTPLEEIARIMLYNSWGGDGDRWSDDTLHICRDFQADGLVLFEQTGCQPVLGLGQMVADRLEREMGKPAWCIEGRMLLGRTDRAEADFMSGLQAFVNRCFENKNKSTRPK